MMRSRFLPLAFCVLLLGGVIRPSDAAAQTLYVDNRSGSNANDGITEVSVGGRTGPVRTISRALQLAEPGATISVANTGTPYFEAMRLGGSRHSGFNSAPFTILGNGAVVSGARPVPRGAWKEFEDGLWRFTPWRKGHFQLLLNAQPVPEVEIPIAQPSLPDLPAGSWCAWKGSIWYRAAVGDPAPTLPFWYAADEVGLTLYEVENVRVQDLTFQHFRLDGINAHDRAANVVLDNVVCTGNGRAGLAVGGTSSVAARGCRLAGNRRHSLLMSELGAAELIETTLDRPATVAP